MWESVKLRDMKCVLRSNWSDWKAAAGRASIFYWATKALETVDQNKILRCSSWPWAPAGWVLWILIFIMWLALGYRLTVPRTYRSYSRKFSPEKLFRNLSRLRYLPSSPQLSLNFPYWIYVSTSKVSHSHYSLWTHIPCLTKIQHACIIDPMRIYSAHAKHICHFSLFCHTK